MSTSQLADRYCKRWYDTLININLFNNEDDLSLLDQLLTTRIFLALFTILLFLVISFTALTFQTQTVVISSPSETIFNDLSIRYPSTLSCSCRQTSIRYDEFLSLHPRYHPVCSSQFVNRTFIASALSDMKMSDYWTTDYRVMLASHLQILALFCQSANETINDLIAEFTARHIITTQVLFHNVFETKIAALIEELNATAVTNNIRTNVFLWSSIARNIISTGLRSDYYIVYPPDIIQYQYWSITYRSVDETDCTCKDNDMCSSQAAIYNWTGREGVDELTISGDIQSDPPALFRVPGMLVGCYPYTSLLQSTLECFYDQSCLDLLQLFIPELSFTSPISSSRFPQNTTVEDLYGELFVESWNNQSNFTEYFQRCSPQSCSYSYDQRFNWIHVLITLVGLAGGLMITTSLLSLILVKIIRKLQQSLRKCHRNPTDQITTVTKVNAKRTVKETILTLSRPIHQRIVTLNLFPLLSDIKDGIYATRVYFLTLYIALLILIFYASISVQLRTITISHPSLDVYEKLHNQYSSTIVCPCTRLSMPYQSVMNVQLRFHQICSSDFVNGDVWLLYFGMLSEIYFYAYDFRIMGLELFRLLEILCKMAIDTVQNELKVFNDTQSVSVEVMTKDRFNAQTSVLIGQFQRQVGTSLLDLFALIRTSIQLNQLDNFGGTVAFLAQLVEDDPASICLILNNDFDNGCSCGTDTSCAGGQGFYCGGLSCSSDILEPNQTIPGLVRSCLLIDSLLASSLQCFYNASCIHMLIELRSFEVGELEYDPRLLDIHPLDSTIKSRFLPETTLDPIFSQLFIEDWSNSSNFTAYYNQCAPDQCTYTYQERFNRAYLISTILGIIGGLSVALKILIPPIITLLRRIYQHCHRPAQPITNEASIEPGVLSSLDRKYVSFMGQLWNYLRAINVYRTKHNVHTSIELPSNNGRLLLQQQQIATRFYILLLYLSMTVVLLFNGLRTQTHSITISSPTESMFDHLQTHHSSSLSCPCSHITLSYSTFLSIESPIYHQICSSYFVSSNFTKTLWRTEDAEGYLWYMDSKILSTQFRFLSAFCSLTRSIVKEKIESFIQQELITWETLSRHSFQVQMDSILKNFLTQTPANFRRIHHYINDIIHANQLMNIFFTNWNLSVSNDENNWIMSTYPTEYKEIDGHSCSCATSSTCSRSTLVKGNSLRTIPGFVVGCLPIYGLRQSTLECFYNYTCLRRLANFMDSSFILNFANTSINSRFIPVSSISIGTLIDEMFIETWQTSHNYSTYFTNCAPSSCHYTYIERNTVVSTLTTSLGLYGGLTIGINFLVWQFFSVYWKVCRKLFRGDNRIMPTSNQ